MNKSSIVLSAVALALVSGCAVYRDLRITEVGFREVEIYLDEPADHTLALQDHVFSYIGSGGETNEFELFGSLDGGEFIVIWEDPHSADAPSAADYYNFDNRYVRGIRVPTGFFGTQTNTQSYAYRVHGRHKRGTITDKVDDVVKFGPSPRPSIGGVFTETMGLTNATRTVRDGVIKAETVSRFWRAEGLVENDREDDWRMRRETFGKANR